MKITTEQLNKVLEEAFGEIWIVEVYEPDYNFHYFGTHELIKKSYYNSEKEAIKEVKKYNKEHKTSYATLFGLFDFNNQE